MRATQTLEPDVEVLATDLDDEVRIQKLRAGT